IEKCTLDDLDTLKEISCKTFRDTYAHLNSEDSVNAYLENTYNHDKLQSEILNSESSFYFIFMGGYLAGYLKLNEHKAQTDIHDPDSIEIERIYVLRGYQGKGLGRYMIDKAVEVTTIREKSYLWLGVWEFNEKAIRFYNNNGFCKIGEHSFFVGDEEQTDYLLRKDITLD
ncbi:MAG: Prolyl aminopeptidase, partial [Oscillospiraceae bacterium]|nr:Prolyl aminopeptidase [Oscillospiraceae bacterium]